MLGDVESGVVVDVDGGTVVDVVVVATAVEVVVDDTIVLVVVVVVEARLVDVDVDEVLPFPFGWVVAGAWVEVVGRPGLRELGMSMFVPSPNWRLAFDPQQVTLPSLL